MELVYTSEHTCVMSPDQLHPHVKDSSMQTSPNNQHSYQGIYPMPSAVQNNPKVIIEPIISLTVIETACLLQQHTTL